jgi:hypothetical protein
MNWHPYAEEWPLLKDVDPEGWEAFKAGIKATNGIADNPVRFRVADGKMEGLDGRNRYLACKELRIKAAVKKVRVKDEDVTDYVDRWNLHRRHHMTAELRQKLVAKRRDLGQSLREIADGLGTSKDTVARDLEKADSAPGVSLETPGHQKQAEKPQAARKTVNGQDGKTYPAKQAKLSPAVQQRIAAGSISPKRTADFEELTHGQQAEALVLFDGGMKLHDALRRVVEGDAGDEEKRRRAPQNGRPVYDLKEYERIFGSLYKQTNRVLELYRLKETPQSEELERDLKAWDAKFRAWHSEVSIPATAKG